MSQILSLNLERAFFETRLFRLIIKKQRDGKKKVS